VTSQRKPDNLDDEQWGRSVQIATPYRRTWGFKDYISGAGKTGIQRAVDQTMARIRPSFDQYEDPLDAGHVVLDEIRGDTVGAAAELFRQLPPEMRGRISAYIVGGPKVNYNNPNFKDAKILQAMRQADVDPVMETYGSPQAGDKQARAVAANYQKLVNAGLDPSLSVGGLDRFNNPAGAAWQQGDRFGNQQLESWVGALRRAMPNANVGVWPAGTRRQPISPGRMSSLLRALRRAPVNRGEGGTP
jgi:hypothetical protein